VQHGSPAQHPPQRDSRFAVKLDQRNTAAQRNMAAIHIAALRAASNACQAPEVSFSDEQAVQGLAIADELRARFLPPDPATLAQAASLLMQLPAELLSDILSNLYARDLACLAGTCRSLSPPRAIGPVEMELWRRAEARGLHISSSLHEGASSWLTYLLKADARDAQRRQAPLAVGAQAFHSIFVDREGRLLTCGGGIGLGHAADPAADPAVRRQIGPPTPVPSMLDRRIVSVVTSNTHCYALSTEGQVYSWGEGSHGALGHGDEGSRGVPSRIESLSRIERIATGPWTWSHSAAVDEAGRLFTWGAVNCFSFLRYEFLGPYGLGYELDHTARCQLTPKRVDALAQERVVDVALGCGFTLVVTSAGSVFSCGAGTNGILGHGLLDSEVLPRRIKALAQTGRRFVAVAAGDYHALALTEGGELYGWGYAHANGHGREERTPSLVAALTGQRVKLVDAQGTVACAVMEEGELFTRGDSGHDYNVGHEDDARPATPKRVNGLRGVKVAAVAIGRAHMLAADVDGVVWGCGLRTVLVLGASGPLADYSVRKPTPIPTLRVRILNSP